MKLLVVDDETVALTSVRRLLKRRWMGQVDVCENGRKAVELIKNCTYDVVLLDLLMPEMDGLQVLETVRPFCPQTEFIMLTAVDDVSMAVKAIRLGAYDYLVKPVENERLVLTIQHAFERKGLRAGLAGGPPAETGIPDVFKDILTRCERMYKTLSYAEIMARSDIPILLTGETGTGKELLARGIHRASSASAGPFIPVNVSAIPETLFESQFFGHIKGAFTGAESDQAGFFERADGGTLFLDEIGELPLNLQAKLLRALEERIVTRVGDTKPISFHVRILSATNRDLESDCRSGRFRLDLFYRINSVCITLPPLRERQEDILHLADFFLKEASHQHGRPIVGFAPGAVQGLLQKEYPGNIRELKQIVQRAVLVADGEYIEPAHLGEKQGPAPLSNRTLCTLQEAAEDHVAFVLRHAHWDRKKAAKILGVSIRQVQRRIASMRENGRLAGAVDDL